VEDVEAAPAQFRFNYPVITSCDKGDCALDTVATIEMSA
jgi:hypothetical protein